jgi:hypothetical protein
MSMTPSSVLHTITKKWQVEHMQNMMSFPVAKFKIMKNDLCLERAQGLTKS